MADIDLLPQRGLSAIALVDANGIAANGSQTVAQLAARGMRSICPVDAMGIASGGATMLQLAQRGIRAFCPVDENGLATDASTAATLRSRGIRPMVLLNASGIALSGSATALTLAQRGLQCFCPVNESGNATSITGVQLSNASFQAGSPASTAVGTFSVVGGSGTYVFSLTDSAGTRFKVAGTNGVNLQTATTLATAGTYNITVTTTGGTPNFTQTFTITANLIFNTVAPSIAVAGGGPAIETASLSSSVGTWTGIPTIAYANQWKRDGTVNIGGPGSVYVITAADVGHNISLVVTATDAGGSAQATSNTIAAVATLPVNLTVPVISGSPSPGITLTTTDGTWSGSPTSFTYQWKRGGTNVGTNANSYTVVSGDLGATITVTVTGINTAGNASATSLPTVAVAVPPDAPVLALTSGPTDSTPDFTLTGDLVLADVVRLEYANNSGFTGATSLTNTIDAGEDAANSLNFVTPALANGTWYFRSRIERGGLLSGWSNTESETIALAYVGPGDVVTTGWVAWYGFRSFSAARRGPSFPLIRIRQQVSLGEQDFYGDATTGLIDPVAIQNFLDLGTGHLGLIVGMYDQVGSRNIGAEFGGVGEYPYNPTKMALEEGAFNSPAVGTALPQPFTIVGVGQHNTGSGQAIVCRAGGAQLGMALGGAATSTFLYAGTVLSGPAAAEDTPHVLIGVFDGSNSFMRTDSAETGPLPVGPTGVTTTDEFSLGNGSTKYTFEGGVINGTIDITARTNLANNCKTFYGIT